MIREIVIIKGEIVTIAATFPTIIAIVNGNAGETGTDIIGKTKIDILVGVMNEIDKGTSHFHSVRIPEIIQHVSLSDYIIDVPCYKCLVFIMCKQRLEKSVKSNNSVVGLAYTINCPWAKKFVEAATQENINQMRLIFGLEAYP